MNEHALPINSMTEVDSQRIADALRMINTTMVSKQMPAENVAALASSLETLAKVFDQIPATARLRGFGDNNSETAAGSGFDYGSGNSLAYRPISGLCNALAAPAQYFIGKDVGGKSYLKGTVTFGAAFEGPPKLVHGGYIAAYMDEVFGMALSHSDVFVPAMTGTLKTVYRRPVPLNIPVTYMAQVTGEEGRKVFLHCTLKDNDGTLYAEGEAIFLKIDPKVYAMMAGG